MRKSPPAQATKGRAAAAPAVRSAAAPDRERMGVRLRTLRKARKLTLKALSGRSQVALSTLSKMELGQVSASYEKLAAVARALQVDLAALFDAESGSEGDASSGAAGARPVVVRSTLAAAPHHDSPQYRYRLLASGFPGKRMQPMHGTIVARRLDEFPDYVRHPGQEHLTVLAGRVRICFETGETVELGRWDSAYFDSGIGHVYLSVGRGDAQVMVVMFEG
jgi:transcriptional regulator with XRE-family HTH domain